MLVKPDMDFIVLYQIKEYGYLLNSSSPFIAEADP